MKTTDRILALIQLFKLRMTFHILITTLIGFYLASPEPLNWVKLGWTLLGTGLLAISAFCFNQAMEKNFDLIMIRTQKRPIPMGRLNVPTAYVAGMSTCILGALLLWQKTNLLTAGLGLLTVALYAGVYTPMKRLTTLNTLVGAIPGALPPLIGWTAIQDHIGLPGMLLFALLFFWQLPHFLALAWMYKDDYRRGGFKMLSLVDTSGAACFRQIIIQTVLLMAVSIFPYVYGLTGEAYLVTSLLAGLTMLWLAIRLLRSGTREDAKKVFLFSLIYVPLVLVVMAVDKRILFIG